MLTLMVEVHMPRIHEINAVHEKNLEKLLADLSLLDSIRDGHVSCMFCGKRISLDNLYCIYPKDDQILFCCNDVKCFGRVLENSGSEKKDA